MLKFWLDESGRIGLCGKWDEIKKKEQRDKEGQRKVKDADVSLNEPKNPFLLFKTLLVIFHSHALSDLAKVHVCL